LHEGDDARDVGGAGEHCDSLDRSHVAKCVLPQTSEKLHGFIRGNPCTRQGTKLLGMGREDRILHRGRRALGQGLGSRKFIIIAKIELFYKFNPKMTLRTESVLDIFQPQFVSFTKLIWKNATKKFGRILQDSPNDIKFKKFKKIL